MPPSARVRALVITVCVLALSTWIILVLTGPVAHAAAVARHIADVAKEIKELSHAGVERAEQGTDLVDRAGSGCVQVGE